MKNKYSSKWISSIQPRKQRKYRLNAPLHKRQKMVSAHLDAKLREQFNKRSLPVRKGDEVQIMVGKFKGQKGNVTRTDLSNLKVFVEGIKRKKVSGQEVYVPLDPSNVKIIKLNMTDKKRMKFVERKENLGKASKESKTKERVQK